MATATKSGWRAEAKRRGDALKREIRRSGLTQREVAFRLDIDESVLSNRLNGARRWPEGWESEVRAVLAAAAA